VARTSSWKGKTASITSLTISHDAKSILVGFSNYGIILFGVLIDAGALMHKKGTVRCTGGLNSMAFSPNGRRFALASVFNTINVFDTDMHCHLTLESHNDTITTIAYSLDGSRIFSASMDKAVKVWQAVNGSCLMEFGLDRTISIIRFGTTMSCLQTEFGSFDLSGLSPGTSSPLTMAAPTRPPSVGYGFNEDGTWITWNSSNLLWLPPNYRSERLTSSMAQGMAAIGGSALTIAYGSAQPLIINFASECDFQI
jgi:hypothetical protein